MKHLNTYTDTELVTAYHAGKKEAFPFLVKNWHLKFCKMAFWIVKDVDVAKDIAQESWSTIMSKIGDLKEPKKFKSWATSIVNRKAIDYLRTKNRERIKLQKIHYENNTDNIAFSADEDLNIKKQLLESIKKLSAEHQMILQLFYKESYSLREISEILKISVGTIKSRLFHAREKLKTSLKSRNYER